MEVQLKLFQIAVLMTIMACQPQSATIDQAYQDEMVTWREKRVTALKAEDGFINLVGLFWLKPGTNTFGADTTNDLIIEHEAVAPFIGIFNWENGRVQFEASDKRPVTVDGSPVTQLIAYDSLRENQPVLNLGSLHWVVIKRADELAVRVRDLEHPALADFELPTSFPLSSEWRVQASFVPYNPPKMLNITNIIGLTYQQPSPGKLVFTKDGEVFSLDPTMVGDQFFITFADATTGNDTYGLGRYLYAGPPDEEGNLVIDFNKAYNPPCAFTEFATCPLPPNQNRLELTITAGEKDYHTESD